MSDSKFCISLEDIQQAAVRISDEVLQTPLLTSESLSRQMDADLWFKCENLQHGGAFKARGAGNAVLSLTPTEAARGVIAHSSGNHAAALARAASRRGLKCRIVMPHNSAAVKIAAVRSHGVEPDFCEPTAQARQAMTDQLAAETGATFIHPYNDCRVIAGQGTAALELLRQAGRVDDVIVPVGGGGLLSGTLVALKALNPEIRVYGAEPEWADDAFRSLRSGSIQPPLRYDTLADGLRTPLGNLTFPIIRELVDDILTVNEDGIRDAAVTIRTHLRVIAEPSGAVPLAAARQYLDRFRQRRVVLVISGGNTG
ncbi:MAG: threonine/serine dehydratase [Planctomycetaceae bacterium]